MLKIRYKIRNFDNEIRFFYPEPEGFVLFERLLCNNFQRYGNYYSTREKVIPYSIAESIGPNQKKYELKVIRIEDYEKVLPIIERQLPNDYVHIPDIPIYNAIYEFKNHFADGKFSITERQEKFNVEKERYIALAKELIEVEMNLERMNIEITV